MDLPWPYLLAAAPLAYLLGTFPSAELVARRKGIDIRAAGSGNPGASNVGRLLGWRAFVLVFAIDASKGAAAAGAGYLCWGRPGAYVLGIAAIAGHMFPVWRRFRGGKGVATGSGVMAVLFPFVMAILVAAWFLIARVLRMASLASIVVLVAAPVLAWLTGREWQEIAVLAAAAVVLIARHWRNVVRIARGHELALQDKP